MKFNSFDDLKIQLLKGEMILVFDEYREIEGDFFFLAEHVTPEKMNFMFTYGKGLPTIPCDKSILDSIGLKPMVEKNENPHATLYYQSFDAVLDVTTGVSAFDQAKSIQVLVDESASRKDITVPGHSFPLCAQDPQKRFGHTEAGVLLAKAIGVKPAMVICEILNEEGAKATLGELQELSVRFNMPITTLELLKKELL